MSEKLITPKTYLVGFTTLNIQGIEQYLKDSDQEEFLEDINEAKAKGLSEGEILCSMYAKMCYASLTTKKNKNISKIRGIDANIKGTIESGHGCYDENTEVLTIEGWKKWPSITKNDIFATLSNNGILEWQSPTNIFNYNYTGDMITYDSQHVDLLVTPNHNMFVNLTSSKKGRIKAFENYNLYQAKDILDKPHSFIKALPIQNNTNNPKSFCALHALLGFAIGDGSISSEYLQFHLLRPRKIAYLKNLVKDLNIPLSVNDGRFSIKLSDLEFSPFRIVKEFNVSELFKQIYTNKKKQIPKIILTHYHNDQTLIHSLFDGLINSDGSKSSTGTIYDTTSEILANDFQCLCNLLGYGSNISQADCYKQRESSFGKNPIYRIHILKRSIKPDFNKSSANQYKKPKIVKNWSGTVYCAEVPNHTLFVRRNGKTVWCGNSVFEHCSLNFLTTNCSRVYTHEQVRHRVGTAYSQTSGRYVRTDNLQIVFDPILEPVKGNFLKIIDFLEKEYAIMEEKMGLNGEIKDFATKKKITSALRRILPNGQGNELGFSINLRSLRHLIELRTSRHAEWEIRLIYGQVYDLIHSNYPTMFFDATIEIVDGLREISFKNKKI